MKLQLKLFQSITFCCGRVCNLLLGVFFVQKTWVLIWSNDKATKKTCQGRQRYQSLFCIHTQKEVLSDKTGGIHTRRVES